MQPLIHLLNNLPTDLIWIIQIIACYATLLLMLRLFSFPGLYVFITIGVIAANIEVLKIIHLPPLSNPIALGTVFFSSAYLATDIITEYFGPNLARKGILMGFAGSLLMLTYMTLTLSFKPLAHFNPILVGHETDIQKSLLNLFSPTPALLTASLASYLVSQFFDIWVFQRIRLFTGKKILWLRSNVSTILSALLDSIVFNVLAWEVLTPHPVTLHTLFFTYMLATYLIRILIAIVGTPAIYIAKYALPQEQRLAWEKE